MKITPYRRSASAACASSSDAIPVGSDSTPYAAEHQVGAPNVCAHRARSP